MLTKETIEKSLFLLSAILDRTGTQSYHIIVCGGSSLIVTGLVPRATRDIDVIGLGHINPEGIFFVEGPAHLPPGLKETAERVARELDLPENWLNMGPAGQVSMGLPKGFIERLITRPYGRCLTVSFISRLDQIHLKLIAAADGTGIGGSERHFNDLQTLRPTEQELEMSVEWGLTWTVGMLPDIKKIIKGLGYDELAARL